MASFFSGLANQAQGLIAEKMGKGEPAAEGAPAEGEVPVEGAENGEVPPEGGIGGFMGGMMAKANAVKAVAAEKAGGLSGGNLQVSPVVSSDRSRPLLVLPAGGPTFRCADAALKPIGRSSGLGTWKLVVISVIYDSGHAPERSC
jgi:hypothetical protein